jgi:hypothetical protein
MFDLVEHTEKYSGSDESVNIEAMQQNNIDRWVRSEELSIEEEEKVEKIKVNVDSNNVSAETFSKCMSSEDSLQTMPRR